MKKRLLLCVTAALCLMLVACGKKEGASPVTIAPNENNENVKDDVVETDKKEDQAAEPVKAEASREMFATKATIEETVLVDQNNVKIIATGIDYTDTRATLHLTIENNDTKDLSIYSATALYDMNTINGCVVAGGYVNSDVTAGMKSLEDVYFSKDELLRCGIYDISEIGMAFYVTDSDYNDLFKTDLSTIPTSIYDQCDFSEDTIKKSVDEGVWENELEMKMSYVNTDFNCSQDGLNIVAVMIAESKDESSSIYLELENTTDHTAIYSSSDLAINGISVGSGGTWDSYFIPAHKRTLINFELDYLIDEEYRSLISKDKIGNFEFDLDERDFDTLDEIGSSKISIVFDESLADSDVGGTPIYDANGIKTYALPVTMDDYGMNYYIPIYVENNSDVEICIDVDDGSLSMDGYMLDFLCFSETIEKGDNGVLKLEVFKEKAEELQIKSVDDFTTASCKLEIKDYENYSTMDTPTVELKFK